VESLARKLEAFREGMLERADPKLGATLERYYAELIGGHAADAAARVGDAAPDFTLSDQDRRRVSLHELLQRGPVVLSFFRGGWCPYCALSLRALARAVPKFQRHGAELLAIAPEAGRCHASGGDCWWLPFPVLTDHDNAVARRYGLVLALPPEVQEAYRRLGHDLPAINKVPRWELPMPAGYVVAPDGRIVFAAVDPRPHRRMEPADALAALEALRQAAE
jgi:peroxiredoxin